MSRKKIFPENFFQQHVRPIFVYLHSLCHQLYISFGLLMQLEVHNVSNMVLFLPLACLMKVNPEKCYTHNNFGFLCIYHMFVRCGLYLSAIFLILTFKYLSEIFWFYIDTVFSYLYAPTQ